MTFFSYVWARTSNKEGLWILWPNFDHSIFDSRESQRYCVILSIYLSYKVINSTNKYFFNYCRRVLSVQNYQAYLSSSSSRLRLTEAPELFSAGSLVPGLVHHTHNNCRFSRPGLAYAHTQNTLDTQAIFQGADLSAFEHCFILYPHNNVCMYTAQCLFCG